MTYIGESTLLSDRLAGPEGDLLGLTRLLGALGGPLDEDPSRSALRVRFQDPSVLRNHLRWRYADGYRGAVVINDPKVFEVWGRRQEKDMPAPIPLVPNLRDFMRDAVEHGMAGAGLMRVRQAPPIALAGMMFRNVGRLPSIMRGDSPTKMGMFMELELSQFGRYDPPLVLLNAQITDMALAFGNPRLLEAFFGAVRSRTGAMAGLATFNFGTLAARLSKWGLEAEAVMAPWSADGAHMRPSPDVCRQAGRACSFPIWADCLGHAAPPSDADRQAMLKGGLMGAVRDDAGLWVAREPRAMD